MPAKFALHYEAKAGIQDCVNQCLEVIRMRNMKVWSYLLVALFIMLLVAAANHESSAVDSEAKTIFVVR
jgi:hypothetical protein